MLESSGIRAWIGVDGKELKQYGVQASSDRKLTCWIASEEGKRFSVCWWDIAGCRSLTLVGRLHIDGFHCGSRILTPTEHCRSVCVSNVQASSKAVRSFEFSHLYSTDDESYLNTPTFSERLGEISLDIFTANTTRSSNMARTLQLPEEEIVHESLKKGRPHHVKFGAEIPRIQDVMVRAELLSRIATFVFKYRPFDILKAGGLIPRSLMDHENYASASSQQWHAMELDIKPEPDVKSEDDCDLDPAAELKAILERAKMLEAELARQKKKVKLEDTV